MNKLIIGLADKTEQLCTKAGIRFIDDGAIANVFLSRFNGARLFDPHVHSFEPVKDTPKKEALDFADLVYPDKDLMTHRDGESAVVRILYCSRRKAWTASLGEPKDMFRQKCLLMPKVGGDAPLNRRSAGDICQKTARPDEGDNPCNRFIRGNGRMRSNH